MNKKNHMTLNEFGTARRGDFSMVGRDSLSRRVFPFGRTDRLSVPTFLSTKGGAASGGKLLFIKFCILNSSFCIS
jgi:hypothetical protein